MKNKIILISILFLFSMNSCKKYEEGPRISWYSKKERVAGNWLFARVYFNETDSTKSFLKLSLQCSKDGDLTMVNTYYADQGVILSIPGSWEFQSDKEKIYMEFFDSINGNFDFLWDIKRLNYYDMWLERLDTADNLIRWELFKTS